MLGDTAAVKYLHAEDQILDSSVQALCCKDPNALLAFL